MLMRFCSPYTASITGGGFLFEETNLLLSLFISSNRVLLIKDEILNNNILHVNSESARKRIVAEISKRFDSMPSSFWEDYIQMNEDDQLVAIFYVIMKTYKIVFDFHINITPRICRLFCLSNQDRLTLSILD